MLADKELEPRVPAPKYSDGDMLTARQAAEVVSENSGYAIDPNYLCHAAEKLHAVKFGNLWMYPYSSVKNYSRPRPELPEFKDGDMLTASQAAMIISENSGHAVHSFYVNRLAEKLGAVRFGPHWRYPYSSVKNFVVSSDNAGRRRLPDSEVKKRSLYMREYKARVKKRGGVPGGADRAVE